MENDETDKKIFMSFSFVLPLFWGGGWSYQPAHKKNDTQCYHDPGNYYNYGYRGPRAGTFVNMSGTCTMGMSR